MESIRYMIHKINPIKLTLLMIGDVMLESNSDPRSTIVVGFETSSDNTKLETSFEKIEEDISDGSLAKTPEVEGTPEEALNSISLSVTCRDRRMLSIDTGAEMLIKPQLNMLTLSRLK
jgi:hypothetical protein